MFKATRWAREEAKRSEKVFNTPWETILEECQKEADKAFKMDCALNNIIQKHMVESWCGMNCMAGQED